MKLTRRGTLLAAGATVGLAGCVDGLPGASGDDPDPDGDGNRTGDGDGDGNGDGARYDVFQLGQSLDRPLWRMDEGATGFVGLLSSEDDRPWMVDDPSSVEGLESWLDETDFETQAIAYVETVGPNTCYGELEVRDVDVQDGEVVGTAEAVDTRGEDEGCGSAETHPSALVRVTGDERPTGARFTVTDGWGESGEVVADGLLVDPEHLPGHVRPSGDPGKIEALTCEDENFERHWAPDGDVALGETRDGEDPAFAMQVRGRQAGDGSHDHPVQFGRGDEVRVTMWNVSTDVRYTGNRNKINLQVLTADGWRDVRGTPDGERVGYTDEALEHRPGDGFEWTFEMTEAGVLEGHVHEDRLEVCPDLQPGRYRFLHQEAGGGPLGVEFDYAG